MSPAKPGFAFAGLPNVSIADYFLAVTEDQIGKECSNGEQPTHWGFGLGGVFRAIGNALVTLGEANSRVRRAEALQALTDAELAAKGLKREDIPRHVFRDIFFV